MITHRRARLVLAVSACLILTPGCSGSGDSSPSASASPTPMVAGTADPTTAPTEVSTPAPAQTQAQEQLEEGEFAGDLLEAVPVSEAVALDDGLVVSVGEMTAAEITAGIGDVGGPGVFVPVTVSNSSAEEISLSGLVVTMEYGAENTPATAVLSASDEMPAAVAPGEAFVIEMAFTLPVEGRDQVRVVVDSGADSRAAVFEGSAPTS